MHLITIIVIAIALAMDAFAVSIVTGTEYRQLKIKHALRLAGFFGGFQTLMPLIGYLAGVTIEQYIADYDHWVAFGLLAAVGSRMIYGAIKIKPTAGTFNPDNIFVLLALSIATSIDALTIGITLPILKTPVAIAVIIIGLITFALSYAGVLIGGKLGHFFENKIKATGGLILIGLGTKILLEHLLL